MFSICSKIFPLICCSFNKITQFGYANLIFTKINYLLLNI